MQPRVIAVVVARNGADYLPSTLAALAAQTRRPDTVIPVDVASGDLSPELLLKAYPAQLVRTPGRASFGNAVAHALTSVPAVAENEWLWLLGHDNAPAPGALSALLGAVEVAPSVAIAGPKLMSWDKPDVIANFGETMTRFGRSLPVVENELDQAQHDIQSDLLGVAAGGMLVRRSTWTALGGFDSSLPNADAALDFSIRARLAGHRVIGVPLRACFDRGATRTVRAALAVCWSPESHPAVGPIAPANDLRPRRGTAAALAHTGAAGDRPVARTRGG